MVKPEEKVLSFNPTKRKDKNNKFVFSHIHNKPKYFGDSLTHSPIGLGVTGRTDAMALTSRLRSFCKESMQKCVKSCPSENPLHLSAVNQTNATQLWETLTRAEASPTKWFPQNCEDSERRDVTAHSWREPRLISGARGGGRAANIHRPEKKTNYEFYWQFGFSFRHSEICSGIIHQHLIIQQEYTVYMISNKKKNEQDS